MYIFLSLGKRPLMENYKPGNLGGGEEAGLPLSRYLVYMCCTFFSKYMGDGMMTYFWALCGRVTLFFFFYAFHKLYFVL